MCSRQVLGFVLVPLGAVIVVLMAHGFNGCFAFAGLVTGKLFYELILDLFFKLLVGNNTNEGKVFSFSEIMRRFLIETIVSMLSYVYKCSSVRCNPAQAGLNNIPAADPTKITHDLKQIILINLIHYLRLISQIL